MPQVKIEKEASRKENEAKRSQFLAQCQQEKREMQKQLEEVAVAKEKRRTDRMEAHAKWVAENPGGAMAKVQEHQQRNMEKAEQGREEARQHEAMLEQRAAFYLEMNTQSANEIKAAKEGVCEAAKRKAREDKMDLANERKQMAKVLTHCACVMLSLPSPGVDCWLTDSFHWFMLCSWLFSCQFPSIQALRTYSGI